MGHIRQGINSLLFIGLGTALFYQNCSFRSFEANTKSNLSSSSNPSFVEEAAMKILADNCASCHGNGSSSGDFGDVLDAEAMFASGMILRGDAANSPLLARIRDGSMPPGGELIGDIRTLEDWINGTGDQPNVGGFPVAACEPTAQFVGINHLNKTELLNTIRDIFGVELPGAENLPEDFLADGFSHTTEGDNINFTYVNAYLNSLVQLTDLIFDDVAARTRLRTCTVNDDACRTEIITNIAQKAFRQPVDAATVSEIVSFANATNTGGFNNSLRIAFRYILMSPKFLYRVEPGNLDRELTHYEIASRLSYFLWGTMPDQTLFDLAAAEQLKDQSVLLQQVRRMLQDDRGIANLSKHFMGGWMELHHFAESVPEPELYPEFTPQLKASMQSETEAFLESLLREDQHLGQLFSAEYSYLDETVANHYGVTGVSGANLRRVASLRPSQRGGILAHGSILTQTSKSHKTSIVERGLFVLNRLLCDSPPPPPDDAGELDDELENTADYLTNRQIQEIHLADPDCRSCHAVMDPIGIGLENFDAIGRWRTSYSFDNGNVTLPVDASSQIPGGQSFNGLQDLQSILATEPKYFLCASQQITGYSVGIAPDKVDKCKARSMFGENDDYRFSKIIESIVTSDFFLKKAREEE